MFFCLWYNRPKILFLEEFMGSLVGLVGNVAFRSMYEPFWTGAPTWKKVARLGLIGFAIKTGVLRTACPLWKRGVTVLLIPPGLFLLTITLNILHGVGLKIYCWLFPTQPPLDDQFILETLEKINNKGDRKFPNVERSLAIQMYLEKQIIFLLNNVKSSLVEDKISKNVDNILAVYFLSAVQKIKDIRRRLKANNGLSLSADDFSPIHQFSEFYQAFIQAALVTSDKETWTLSVPGNHPNTDCAQEFHDDTVNRLFEVFFSLVNGLIKDYPRTKNYFHKSEYEKGTGERTQKILPHENPGVKTYTYQKPQLKLRNECYVAEQWQKLITLELSLYGQLKEKQVWNDSLASQIVEVSTKITLCILRQVEALAEAHSLSKEEVRAFILDKKNCCNKISILVYLLRISRSYHSFRQASSIKEEIQGTRRLITFAVSESVDADHAGAFYTWSGGGEGTTARVKITTELCNC